MTIPSIKGNGDSLNKLHLNQLNIPGQQPTEPVIATESIVQPQEIQPATTPATAVEEPQAAEPFQPQEVQDPALQETQNTTAAEKEYSITQFQIDYADLVQKKVLPILKDFEGERKKRLAGAIIAATICIFLAICVFLFVDGRGSGDLFWGLIAAAFGIWFWIKKSFEKKIKRLVMPTLMQAVPGFFWQETPPVTKSDIQESKILPFANKISYSFDDCFIGEYRNVKVAISETECILGSGNNKKTILEGVVIKFQMNKNFDGMTIIRPRKPGYRDKQDDLKRANMTEVKLEDPEFDKKFIVYSTDQVEARYLITTSFMERFKQIETAFSSKFAYCSFCGDSVFIAPHTGKDLFNLCSLIRPIGNTEQFTTLFNEFVSILALVDHFKLDQKLGL